MFVVFQALSLLVSVRELRLDGNRFTGPVLPDHVVSLRASLRTLELSANRLTGSLQDSLARATALPALTLLGWSANALHGSFGNFFGDDDDEGAILFPGENGFVASDGHANAYGEVDPTALEQLVGGVSSQLGSPIGSSSSGGGGGRGSVGSDSAGFSGFASDGSGGGHRHDGQAATPTPGGLPCRALQQLRHGARLRRCALLVGRRKWLLQLTALGVGGNPGLYGTVPPVLICLRMQV
jgi:hypothetical protein